ncbi:MAG: glycosyltransferase family 2 protein [Oscillospiraceae bacterium]|nr:glycosyltransferase family 2 protein [Oscillospiraceae bacterium]
MQGLLSVIIPSYNEEAMIEKTASVISSILQEADIPNELLFVDDGSKDGTWEKITAAAGERHNVCGIHFSRNFGKESAIAAGLSRSKGECCVVIDCDLQHPPEKIVEMYRLWQQGFEVIEGQKSSRGQESGLHAFAANSFYALIGKASGIDMANASDFKLLDRKAVDALLGMPERGAFFRALSSWVGFRTATVYFDVREREAGESKWSTKSLIRYALNNISAFSNAPMQFVTVLGVLLLAVCGVWGIVSLIRLIAGYAVGMGTGLALLMLLIGGGCMLGIGILGFYVGRIYDEIKARPRFIIAETCGDL